MCALITLTGSQIKKMEDYDMKMNYLVTVKAFGNGYPAIYITKVMSAISGIKVGDPVTITVSENSITIVPKNKKEVEE